MRLECFLKKSRALEGSIAGIVFIFITIGSWIFWRLVIYPAQSVSNDEYKYISYFVLIILTALIWMSWDGIKRIFFQGPVVIIDENGITDKNFHYMISWSQIVTLSIGEIVRPVGWFFLFRASYKGLCIDVQNSNDYARRLLFQGRFFAYFNWLSCGRCFFITYSDINLSPSLDEVWKFLKANYKEKCSESK